MGCCGIARHKLYRHQFYASTDARAGLALLCLRVNIVTANDVLGVPGHMRALWHLCCGTYDVAPILWHLHCDTYTVASTLLHLHCDIYTVASTL